MQTMPMMPQVDLPAGKGKALGATPDGAGATGPFGQTLATVAQQSQPQSRETMTGLGIGRVVDGPGMAGDMPQTAVLFPDDVDLFSLQGGLVAQNGGMEAVPTKGTETMPWAEQIAQLVEQLPDDPVELAQAVKDLAPELRSRLQRQMPSTETAELLGGQVPTAELPNPPATQLPKHGEGQPVVAPQGAMVSEALDDTVASETATVTGTSDKVVPGHLKKEMDQRFARLLQPKAQPAEAALRQQMPESLRGQLHPVTPEGTAAVTFQPELEAVAKPEVPPMFVKDLTEGGTPLQDLSGNPVLSHGPGPQAPTVEVVQQPQAVTQPTVQLPSGQQVTETVILDQVVTHLSGSHDGESGKMVLRLKPAELGELKLDLVVESDRLKVHLQAQTQQVQDVIERHLPKLRDALEQQGLKVDQLQVDVGSDGEAGESWFARQEQQQPHGWTAGSTAYNRAQTGLSMAEGAMEELIGTPQAMAPGGLSLRI